MIERTPTEMKFEIALLLYKNNQLKIDSTLSVTQTLFCSNLDCAECSAKDICRHLDETYDVDYNLGCLHNGELEEFFLLYPEVKLIC